MERFPIISSDLGSKTNSRLSHDICARKRTKGTHGGGARIDVYCLWTWELPRGIFRVNAILYIQMKDMLCS